jgi:WD40 repeat protein
MTPTHADDERRSDDFTPGCESTSRLRGAAESDANPETAAYPTASANTPPTAQVPLPAIDGYEVLGVLGKGGMGVVYHARHVALKRVVALKMVRVGSQASAQDLARFRVEAEAVARLQHPNIVQIHDVGETAGQPFCALEYLEGGNLAQKLGGKPLAPYETAQLVETLARAMQFAHSRNVIHRDLKPANVLLTAHGTPKVTDFGLARQLDDDSGQTLAGAVMGTPSYMAPEQAAGQAYAAGPAADVYALGAILYECLTGRPPFKGTTVPDTLEQVRTQDPEPPRQGQRSLPRDLETICLKCLRKEPERRYASADALAEDLRRWLADEPIAARPVGTLERAALWVRRKPARAGLVLLLAALIVAVVTFSALWAVRESEVAGSLSESNQNLLRTQDEREAALKQARQESARAALDRGLNACEAGDVGLGLNYLTRALDRAVKAEDADLESAIRMNLATWDAQLWSLRYYREGPSGAKVSAASLSPSGALLAVTLANDRVELWDLRDGHEGKTLHSLPHGEPVRALAFSGDGGLLLTRTDRTVRIWDVATGRLAASPLLHPSNLTAAAISRDGKWVLTGAGDANIRVNDATARLWETATGKCIASIPHKERVAVVAFSPRGELALTGDARSVIQLWKVPSGDAVGPPLVHPSGIEAAAFSPDGARLLTGTTGGTAHLWQIDTGKPVFPPMPNGEWIRAVAFSPDSQRLMVLTRITGQVHLWRGDTGNPIASPLPHQGRVESVAFSPDSRTLLIGSAGGFARGWDAIRGQPTGPLLTHQGVVAECFFSSDGQSIVTVDGAVRRWHAPPGLRRGPPLAHQGLVGAVAFSPDGHLLLSTSWDTAARLWDTASTTGKPRLLKQATANSAAAFSPNGRLALTGAFDGATVLWDIPDGAQRARFKGHTSTVYAVTFSHDGRMALSASADKTARLWDVATAEPRAVLPHTGMVKAVAFSPNDRYALTGGTGGTAALWDLSKTPPIAHSLPHDGHVETVAFSRDGETAITADVAADLKRGSLRLWETATGTLLRTLHGHTAGIQTVAVSQDGKYLVSCSFDRTARLWNLATGESIGIPLQHQAPVRDVAFSRDGRNVFTASEDNTARRWHVPTGLPIGPAFVHGRKVQVVTVHPKGTLAATGSWDHTAGLWEVPGPKDGSPAQLARWVERATGMRLDDNGALRVLPPPESD